MAGLQLEQQCATGHHWSVEDNFCTTPDYAECDIEASLCPETENVLDIIWIPSSRDCNRYYMCFNRTTIPMFCAPGFHWDPVLGWCDEPHLAGCEVNVTPSPEPEPEPDVEVKCLHEGFHHIPHPTSCEYFFICSNFEAILQKCAPGLHWDTLTNRCDNPNVAICGIDPQPQPL